mmetsp:Transcript_15867/g.30685  ORF Transcript_15867/g.30685 Transcript_15867/m.30685 type:complete len:89 (-) Transcript_15867:1386-1652(-)
MSCLESRSGSPFRLEFFALSQKLEQRRLTNCQELVRARIFVTDSGLEVRWICVDSITKEQGRERHRKDLVPLEEIRSEETLHGSLEQI